MANKRKCKLKSCGKMSRGGMVVQMGYYCNIDHAIAYAKENAPKARAKAEKRVDVERARKFYDSDIKTRKKAAKDACHRYIRARDYGKPCPCCGEPLDADFHAGHFHESGKYSFIRYHEDNIHGQRVQCNLYKGGDSGDYERNLRIMIGDERVDWLRANRNTVIKRTAEDYKAIEAEYTRKYKELQRD